MVHWYVFARAARVSPAVMAHRWCCRADVRSRRPQSRGCLRRLHERRLATTARSRIAEACQ